MGRKKINENRSIPEFEMPKEEDLEIKDVPNLEEINSIVDEPPIIEEPKITMNEYLSNHSQKRSLDVVFTNWFKRKDATNPLKTVPEWDKLIYQFLNEVV
jgi:hypothetical protein